MTDLAEQNEKKKNFINERIVPRKPFKKLLSFGIMSIILGLLFGAMAGISFYASQGILKKNSTAESLGETIVIARDQDPLGTTEAGSSEEPPDKDNLLPSTEWSGDIRVSEANIEPLDKEELMVAEEGASESPEAEAEDAGDEGTDSETGRNGEADEDAAEEDEPEESSPEDAGPEAEDLSGDSGEADDENPSDTEAAAEDGEGPEDPSETEEDGGTDAEDPELKEESTAETAAANVSALSLREMYTVLSRSPSATPRGPISSGSRLPAGAISSA